VLDYEYICDRIAKFHKKILFITRVINILLHQQLLPAIRGLSGNFFTFQQDNAPAHRARETVHLLTHETPDFITAAL